MYKLILNRFIALLVGQCLAGCGTTNFISKEHKSQQNAGDAEAAAGDAEGESAFDADAVPVYGQCPEQAQNILILDFKSGWWAGDGGEFFNTVLSELTLACESTIKIEYHHMIVSGIDIEFPSASLAAGKQARQSMALAGGIGDWLKAKVLNTMMVFPGFKNEEKMSKKFEDGFLQTDWNKYTQIWLLSGSEFDSADLNPEHEFFQKVLTATQGSSANIFIGSGYGSITHANSLAAQLGVEITFATDMPEGYLLNPSDGVSIVTELHKGKELLDFHLFSDVGDIADHLQIGQDLAKGDYLATSEKSKVLATNTEGKNSIAITSFDERRVIVDAGMQRYYSIYDKQSPGTLTFIRNIIAYLAL